MQKRLLPKTGGKYKYDCTDCQSDKVSFSVQIVTKCTDMCCDDVRVPYLYSVGYSSGGYLLCTRGIWKVLCMVFYLSNRFTNPIMFDIILTNHLSSMLWHKLFHEDIMMQTRIISL